MIRFPIFVFLIVFLVVVVGCSSIHTAAQSGNLHSVQSMVQSDPSLANAKDPKYGTTPLHQAAGTGHFEVVQYLLSKGADPNATDPKGLTALHYISLAPWLETPKEVVTALIAAGAKVDARDTNGQTPLHEAVIYQKLGAIKLLLDAGADVNARDNQGDTPLKTLFLFFDVRMVYEPRDDWQSKMQREMTIMNLLLDRGADPNIADSNGMTPLHRVPLDVAPSWQVEVAKALVRHGARMDVKNYKGETPISIAQQAKSTSGLVEFLLEQTKKK